MKHTLVRSILTPALAVALPCLAFAQAGSSTPSTKPQDRTTTSSTSSTKPQDRATTSSTPSSAHDRSLSSPGYSSSDAHGGSLQRITSDNLDNQLTAKTLIGTDVHGSDGNKIGEVVDIVLAPSLNIGKHDARMGTGYSGTTGTTSSTSRAATAQNSTSSQTNAAGTRPSNTSASDARSAVGAAASAMGAMNSMQPAVIVSTGGLMGIGNDLVRVPMSKISYDSEKKEVRLNVTEDEWKLLRETRATGVTSTNR